VAVTCILLARILQSEKNFGNETKNLLEQALANFIKNEGVDGVNVAGGNCSMGQFFLMVAMIQSTVDAKKTQLLLAKSYQSEALRIETKLYGPNHPNTISTKAQLSQITLLFLSCKSVRN
jgi:phage gp46-like protein